MKFLNLAYTAAEHAAEDLLYRNTFASQRLVFEEKNQLFLLENASNLTLGVFYDNFNKKTDAERRK